MTRCNKWLISLQGHYQTDAFKHVLKAIAEDPVRLAQICQNCILDTSCTVCVLEVPLDYDVEELRQRLEATTRQQQIKLEMWQAPAETTNTIGAQFILTIMGESLSSNALSNLYEQFSGHGISVLAAKTLDHQDLHVFELQIRTPPQFDQRAFLRELIQFKDRYRLDAALQPDTPYRTNMRLIVFDADMTFIQCEIINEISKLCGKSAEVEAITHRAMNGELDFQQALHERVKMLKGVRVEQLEALRKRIPYTPGAETLVAILKKLGIKVAIVSGGFNYFIDHIKQELGLDYAYANQLEIQDGQLTGRVVGEVVDAHAKARLLEFIAIKEGIRPQQVIAVGDGANDVHMLTKAGLGIAFNAKHFLQECASGSLSRPNLDALLYFLGITHREKEYLKQQL